MAEGEAKIFGIGQAAKMLNISPGALRWHLLEGKAGDIERRGPSGCRLFTEADIARLRTVLERHRR